ncbi:AMP-binding protein [Pseudomaricurvus alkylphenolicus]|uniref:AMP-binding protein n=1 Tax=Pseudomaricurvus alkylphenolicus TaxID=1306991 RepID=UPI001421D5CC|nr:AMP-binding protein [Pseudomaricurvus alkylphenolicus]NIB38429.1 AMP-binding protein [Pseudomaricurvus alkylphenolicus]
MSEFSRYSTNATDEPVEAIEKENNGNCPGEIKTTYDLFCHKTSEDPTAVAMTFLPSGALDVEPIRLSRSELLGNIHQAANMFHELGVGPKDVVSFLLPNLLETHYTLWGSQTAGIANPINFLLGADQICEICNAAGTKVLVALGPHPTLDIWQKVLAIKDQIQTLEKVLIVGGLPETSDDIVPFQQTIDHYPKDRLLFQRNIAESDVASLFHTGGTTGTPKLAPHTHGNEVAAARITAEMYAMSERDVLLNGLPLFHVAAPILLTLAPLSAGAEVLIPSAAGLRDPLILENHWQLLEKYRVTIAGGVPTSLSDLARVPLRDADISATELAICGGASLSGGLAQRFQEHTGLPIHQIYGMTETSGVIAVTPRGRTPVEGSVGMQAPGVNVKAVKLGAAGEPATDCQPGETGVLAVKGKNVFPGYLNSPAECNTFFDDGWLNTGDVGYIDSDGWIFITGRAKDVIIRSGHNIDPSAIEEVADRHPAVSASIAVGQPETRAGEVPVVFVTTNTDTDIDPEDIRKFICSHVPEKPAKPVAVYIVPQLPLTAVGKIYRPKLRCEAIKHLIEKELIDITCAATEPDITVSDNENGNILATIAFRGNEAEINTLKQTVDKRLSQYSFLYSLT